MLCKNLRHSPSPAGSMNSDTITYFFSGSEEMPLITVEETKLDGPCTHSTGLTVTIQEPGALDRTRLRGTEDRATRRRATCEDLKMTIRYPCPPYREIRYRPSQVPVMWNMCYALGPIGPGRAGPVRDVPPVPPLVTVRTVIPGMEELSCHQHHSRVEKKGPPGYDESEQARDVSTDERRARHVEFGP